MNKEQMSIHKKALAILEYTGLALIAVATVAAAAADVLHMVQVGRITLADLLLLFIYLEVLAMIGLYFESGQLPVRFVLYIAIVALARYLIIDMKELDAWTLIAVAAAILVLSLSVLAIRYGHYHLPYAGRRRSGVHSESEP